MRKGSLPGYCLRKLGIALKSPRIAPGKMSIITRSREIAEKAPMKLKMSLEVLEGRLFMTDHCEGLE